MFKGILEEAKNTSKSKIQNTLFELQPFSKKHKISHILQTNRVMTIFVITKKIRFNVFVILYVHQKGQGQT